MAVQRHTILRITGSILVFCLKTIASVLVIVYASWILITVLTSPDPATTGYRIASTTPAFLRGAVYVGLATVVLSIPVSAFCAFWAVFMLTLVRWLETHLKLDDSRIVPPGPVERTGVALLQIRLDEQGGRCPVCRFDLEGEMVSCSRCETAHHRDCWDYLQGCARFGCPDRPATDGTLRTGSVTFRVILPGPTTDGRDPPAT